MGQLEKYGLYVMCLVIFLILGVTLWGEPANASRTEARREAAAVAQLSGPGSLATDATRRREATLRPSESQILALLEPPANPPRYEESRAPSGGVGASSEVVGAARTQEPDAVAKVTPQAAPAQPAPKAERRTYTVRSGDSFSKIASRELGGVRFTKLLMRLNPKFSPKKLPPGSKLLLPAAQELGVKAKPASSAAGSVMYRTYIIRKGDNFERIAASELGSAKRSLELRQLNPNVNPRNMQIGRTVRLPRQ
jgi:LysM repeat protein